MSTLTWTDYHAKLASWELTQKFPIDSDNRLANVLLDAQVDLNPHQIDAALFAFNTPFTKGSILADEVGLGKTIEAGIIISQKWAERKHRILIVVPSNLRKQWQEELAQKFFLPAIILESKNWNTLRKSGLSSPFISDSIILCSYQFARNKADEIKSINWDLVVFDEAHRLRNVYKPGNIIANTLKQALSRAPKILLTATPLQNSLLEFYGLVSIIDEHVFGDIKGFKEQYINSPQQTALQSLKNRMAPFCKRTLRKQVLPYIQYTKRFPILEQFTPEENEDRLYNLISAYLQRPNLQALSAGQRSLMTLIIRKLMASSSFAIAGTLDTLIKRLQAKITSTHYSDVDMAAEMEADYEAYDETADEAAKNTDTADTAFDDDAVSDAEPLDKEQIEAIKQEIADLKIFNDLALSITENAKGKALLIALNKAFAEAERLGAEHKAVIFTESRRTQDYLTRILADTPWGDKLLLFNGSNNDERSKTIYTAWYEKHKGTDKITGSVSADMRSALVDYFRSDGMIMIATEAGAEGINLQFCSLVVNYDLPWNPQRIEQRIGRCHRYGQKHDVVVVNFLNIKNEADQRVYALLSEKFKLFEGVFGSSDEILGSIESGVDFEKRIADIYQNSRKTEEIEAAFDALQMEMSADIDTSLKRTQAELIENFDDEVREKLRARSTSDQEHLSRFETLLMDLTQYELKDTAEFVTNSSFKLFDKPFDGDYPLGLYELPRRSGESYLYRMAHPLASAIIINAKNRQLKPASVEFDLTAYTGKISILEEYKGKSGKLSVQILSVNALDQNEEYFLFAGNTSEGGIIDEKTARRLFSLNGKVLDDIIVFDNTMLAGIIEQQEQNTLKSVSLRNMEYFETEAAKLDGWAEDLKLGLEREIKDIDKQIRETRHLSVAALSLEEKLKYQKEIRLLESSRNTKRKTLFEAQDNIDHQREKLIVEIESKLKIEHHRDTLFEIEWRVV